LTARRDAARDAALPTSTQVAIVGGGVAGCATALSLLRHGLHDFIVLEAEPEGSFRIGETIPPACAAVLRRFGLWEAFLAQGHVPSPGSAASWGKAELGYNDFLLDPQRRGWHLDRARFDGLLAEAVTRRGGALARGLRLRAVEREVAPRAGGWSLTLDAEDGARRLDTEFLVDATGAAAAAARRLGVARNAIDCLTVVHGVFDLAAPDSASARTLLEAAEYGWWYAAALPGGRLIAALSTDRATLRKQRLAEPETWNAALRQTRHVAPLLARSRTSGTPKLNIAIAPSAILSRVTGPGWLAVGDAASSYDPLTSQGIIKALLDGETAGQAIATHRGGGGDDAPLLAYQDRLFAGFTRYLELRRHLYGLERRWRDAPFWRRPLTD
jgi:2-polyprenyl-6-methoxyphenol hydroxylase-like FAD-dependent oxidoreductase